MHEDFHLTGSIEKEATGLPTCVTTLKSHKQENYTGALHPFHVLCNVSFFLLSSLLLSITFDYDNDSSCCVSCLFCIALNF